MLKSLIWKEWHEQRWILAFGCMMLMGFTAISLRARMFEDFGIFIFLIPVGGCFLPLLAAIGMVASEREAGVLPFLQALPVSAGRLMSVKLMFGLAGILLPLFGAWLISPFFTTQDIFTGTFKSFFPWTIWMSLNFFIWTLAFSMRQPTEARVGMVGLGIAGFWIIYLISIIQVFGEKSSNAKLFGVINPIYLIAYDESFIEARHTVKYFQFLGSMLIQLILMLILWCWTVRRFRQAGGARS